VVANKLIGVQMYTITGSSDHYVYIVQLIENNFIINHLLLFAFMATVANGAVWLSVGPRLDCFIHVFQKGMQTDTHSIVTPIPKVNPPQQLSDLRPISHSDSISLLRETSANIIFSLLYRPLTSKTSSISVQLASLPMLLFIFSVMLRGFWSPTPMSDVF